MVFSLTLWIGNGAILKSFSQWQLNGIYYDFMGRKWCYS